MEWFWLWLGFLVIFLLLPLGYGWGYRGWGPPYPGYYRQRRTASGDIVEERSYADRPVAVREETSGWGMLADVLWLVLGVAVIWLIAAWWS
jgi:hypothetical protein